MTLPWFLNPWAEVRRLRYAMRDERLRSSANRAETHRTMQFYRNENAELRRRIASMEEQTGIDQRRTDYIRRTAG